METPPPPASKEEKRPRKRSRYLSPPYNDTLLLQDDDGDIISPASHEEQEEDSNVATADLLAALLQCAADASSAYSSASSSSSSSSPAPAHVLLRFLGLYRASLLPKLDDTHSSAALALPAPARGILTCRAMAIAHGSASTNICCIGPPAAAAQAASKKNKKKVTFAADGNANNASSTPDKKKKKKKKRKSSTGQQHFFRSPAALVLDFTQDQDLPSKEELLSTFRGFGFVVESHTGVSTDGRSARVVFGSSAQAKAAYSCAHTLGLGKLGPPFAIPRLEHLPPIIFGPSSSSPAPKLPLAVMRKNLDKMITSLTCSPSFTKDGAQRLAGEMQRLLARVDNKLSAGPSATAAQNH